MFLDEARIASGIEHANVAQILDLGDQYEVLYLVMEWVDGDSLSRLFRAVERKGERIPVGILTRIIADTCGGLHAAHELTGKDGHLLGVVHRDISPQNILVSVKGTAKLIDFGIAKARDRVAGETNAGNLKGKILYMAPEQALGRPIDRRADVWAVGAVLYHLLSGKPPYEGENQLATLHMLAMPAPPAPLPTSVPKAIADVVMGALVHDPEQRIGTAAELQRRLESALVAANIVTTTADVAAVIRQHLGDRAEQRRQAVDLALEAASDRARVQNLLQPPSADSSSGVKHAMHAPPAQPSGPRLPAMPSSPELLEPGSGATLGSAALVTPTALAPHDERRKRMMVIVAGASAAFVGLIVLVVVVGVALSRSRSNDGKATAGTASAVHLTTPTETTRPDPVPTTTVTAPTTTTIDHPTVSATTTKPNVTVTGVVPTKTITKPLPSASTKKTIDDGF
jgi:serine/threonine-protein kinase